MADAEVSAGESRSVDARSRIRKRPVDGRSVFRLDRHL